MIRRPGRWICTVVALLVAMVLVSELHSATTWKLPVAGNPGTGDLVYGKDRNSLTSLTAVASGQILTSAGVNTAPTWTASPSITGAVFSGLTASKPVFTDGTKALVSTGTLAADQGGTGLATYAVGDLLYASGATAISKLADVATGQVLASGGVGAAPAYTASPSLTGAVFSGLTASKPVFTDGTKALVSTGTLAADQGGTGLASYAVGDIPYASGATTISKLAGVAVGQVLVSGGVTTAPAYSATPTVNTVTLATPKLTAGSGTGVTVNDAGSVRTQVYKVSVAKENFISAGVTHDLTIATLPAGTIVHSAVARVTEAFACTAVCTSSTLSMTLGITAGGTEFLASADIDAAIATFGDANGEMGSALSIAGQFNSGYVSSLTGTTTVVMRATSGTGNWGDAATTNLSAGAITFYLVATVLP